MNVARLAADIVRNRSGGVPRPRWCTYLVCFHCNARCGMCDSWKMKRGAEMTPAEVRTVFDKIGALDVVRLSGGEPFLRPDFAAVADAVWQASKPGVVHITTNGSFPDRVAEFVQHFATPNRLRFMVSFDGLAEEHDANRGANVTFATALETVRLLVGMADRGVKVSVNHTVISQRSLQDHDELKRIFAPLGVDVQAVLAYEDSAMYGRKRQGKRADDLIPRPHQPGALRVREPVGDLGGQVGALDSPVGLERVGERAGELRPRSAVEARRAAGQRRGSHHPSRGIGCGPL
jgi:MoaA/NifB/PqqE/SkfB family radical SAM enzyme